MHWSRMLTDHHVATSLHSNRTYARRNIHMENILMHGIHGRHTQERTFARREYIFSERFDRRPKSDSASSQVGQESLAASIPAYVLAQPATVNGVIIHIAILKPPKKDFFFANGTDSVVTNNNGKAASHKPQASFPWIWSIRNINHWRDRLNNDHRSWCVNVLVNIHPRPQNICLTHNVTGQSNYLANYHYPAT